MNFGFQMLEKKAGFRVLVAVSMKIWFRHVRLSWSLMVAFIWDAGVDLRSCK